MEPQAESPQDAAPNPTPETQSSEPVTTVPETPPAEGPTATTPPTPTPKKSGRKKSTLAVLIIILLLVAGAAVYWFVIKKDKNDKPVTSTTTTTKTEKPKANAVTVTTGPTLLYTTNATADAPGNFNRLEFTTTDKPVTAPFGEPKGSLTFTAMYKDEVAYTLSTGTDINFVASVWLSTDRGATFTKVFSSAPKKSTDAYAADFTTLRFSNDGKNLAFASISGNANIVRSYDIASKSVKDLFTADKLGIFVYYYNVSTNKLYYTKGCYYCDGNNSNQLYERDLKTDTESVLYKNAKPDSEIDSISVNAAGTKILRWSGVAGQTLGGSKPFTVDVYDIAAKTAKTLATVNSDTVPVLGYRESDDVGYFTNESTINTFDATGKVTPYYVATKPIISVVAFVDGHIVFGAGSYTASQLIYYKASTKSVYTIFSDAKDKEPIGVTGL